jgi:hypothetical protein
LKIVISNLNPDFGFENFPSSSNQHYASDVVANKTLIYHGGRIQRIVNDFFGNYQNSKLCIQNPFFGVSSFELLHYRNAFSVTAGCSQLQLICQSNNYLHTYMTPYEIPLSNASLKDRIYPLTSDFCFFVDPRLQNHDIAIIYSHGGLQSQWDHYSNGSQGSSGSLISTSTSTNSSLHIHFPWFRDLVQQTISQHYHQYILFQKLKDENSREDSESADRQAFINNHILSKTSNLLSTSHWQLLRENLGVFTNNVSSLSRDERHLYQFENFSDTFLTCLIRGYGQKFSCSQYLQSIISRFDGIPIKLPDLSLYQEPLSTRNYSDANHFRLFDALYGIQHDNHNIDDDTTSHETCMESVSDISRRRKRKTTSDYSDKSSGKETDSMRKRPRRSKCNMDNEYEYIDYAGYFDWSHHIDETTSSNNPKESTEKPVFGGQEYGLLSGPTQKKMRQLHCLIQSHQSDQYHQAQREPIYEQKHSSSRKRKYSVTEDSVEDDPIEPKKSCQQYFEIDGIKIKPTSMKSISLKKNRDKEKIKKMRKKKHRNTKKESVHSGYDRSHLYGIPTLPRLLTTQPLSASNKEGTNDNKSNSDHCVLDYSHLGQQEETTSSIVSLELLDYIRELAMDKLSLSFSTSPDNSNLLSNQFSSSALYSLGVILQEMVHTFFHDRWLRNGSPYILSASSVGGSSIQGLQSFLRSQLSQEYYHGSHHQHSNHQYIDHKILKNRCYSMFGPNTLETMQQQSMINLYHLRTQVISSMSTPAGSNSPAYHMNDIHQRSFHYLPMPIRNASASSVPQIVTTKNHIRRYNRYDLNQRIRQEVLSPYVLPSIISAEALSRYSIRFHPYKLGLQSLSRIKLFPRHEEYCSALVTALHQQIDNISQLPVAQDTIQSKARLIQKKSKRLQGEMSSQDDKILKRRKLDESDDDEEEVQL